jgi:YVTN family beta-propeller protein
MLKQVITVLLLAVPVIAKPYAYVAIWNGGNGDGNGNTVQVIDVATTQVVTTITVGQGPGSLAVTPDGSRVYVSTGGTVSVISTASNTMIATIPIAGLTGSLAVNPSGQYVYVEGVNNVTEQIYVISVATNAVVATIPMGDYGPYGLQQIVISPDGTRLFVASLVVPNGQYGGVFVIDAMANQVFTSIPLPDGVSAIAIAPNDGAIYVGEINLNQIVKISTITFKVVATISVGSRPISIVITPNGRAAYVADSALFGGIADVEEIKLSTNQLIASIPVGTDPVALAFNSKGNFLYVANQLSNTVSVIDTLDNTVTATIPVSTAPDAIAMKPIKDTQCQ